MTTWGEVSARRLAWHGLAGRSGADPAEIVRRICGAHAQIMSAAEVSIGLRGDGLTCADVQRALWDERTLVKMHGPRGTVHLLPADDHARWTAALAAVPRSVSVPKEMAMTDEQTETVLAAVRDSLAESEPLTLPELDHAVVDRAGAWAGDLVMPAFQTYWPRWRQKIGEAARRGHLIFGPDRGRNVTYTSPRRWLGPTQVSPRPPAAIQWLLTSYLHAYGPARPRDFAQWLATSPAWAEDVFERHADILRRVDLEGRTTWILADSEPADSLPADSELADGGERPTRLLPYFDSYVVAGQPRELLFPGPARQRAQPPGGGAGNYPVVLVDGVVAGVWHQRRAGRRLHITVELLTRATTKLRTAIAAEADRVAAIQQRTSAVTFGDVTVGGHA